jgi:hypothetical protein
MTYISLDFDGTCVKHKYPYIGEEIPNCINTLNELINKDVKLCLNTMRSGKTLDDAVNWFKERNISLYGINTNPDQLSWTTSPKVYGTIYIGDDALGCPLIYDRYDRNDVYVDWLNVRILLIEQGIL